MGNTQGIIWNDSDFTLQYFVYGKFEEMANMVQSTTINPSLTLDILGGTGAKVDGFRRRTQIATNYVYEESMVEVPAGRTSTLGLGNVEMDKHKITIKIAIGEY